MAKLSESSEEKSKQRQHAGFCSGVSVGDGGHAACQPGLHPCHMCTGKEMTKEDKACVAKTHTRKLATQQWESAYIPHARNGRGKSKPVLEASWRNFRAMLMATSH